ncbi:MAG: Eco57I restriction-modification methylase domain-containing protein, partial [Marinilabiliaceae bacterium]
MSTILTPQALHGLFSSPFDSGRWPVVLAELFPQAALLGSPIPFGEPEADGSQGFYLGDVDLPDDVRLAFYRFTMPSRSVGRSRVSLRRLADKMKNQAQDADAVLAVFDGHDGWRVSLVSDIKGLDKGINPRRFTFMLGREGESYRTPVDRFSAFLASSRSFADLCEAFSVEALTRQFYRELFEWFTWALNEDSHITFPSDTTTEDDDRDDIETKIIRMITRIIFVWFIKQKDLVPASIFDVKFLHSVLRDFDPQSATVGNYYNAILQNLFFATLNRAIEDERGNRRCFATSSKRDIKTLYRYEDLFAISKEEVVDLFGRVPFLNGGLFECLDKTKTIDGVERAYNYDGFSRNDKTFPDGRYRNRAVVPNVFFFAPDKGLFSILGRYNFTIEENTPDDQKVALDPELLGKVFENLLGTYNPETRETARNQSGSFYTPREIVNYMVDESLKAYAGNSPLLANLLDSPDFVPATDDAAHLADYAALARRLRGVRILDPACGSGAFPMGMMTRLVDILSRIEPDGDPYERKLHVIENCIYGGDIQCIAIQITKLRFFISLVCDCEKDPSKPNFGIPTLPNLETKFVAADTLTGKRKRELIGNLFADADIDAAKEQLIEIRHAHFSAKTAYRKSDLRRKDEELRASLAQKLAENDFYSPDDARQLAAWNPYDQNAVAEFFDPEWMFGVGDGFDIVIGNPPYVQLQNGGGKLAKAYEHAGYETFARTGDIYSLFYERGWQLLKDGGHLCFITSNKWMRAGYGEKTRLFFATKTNPLLLIDFAGVKVFESATVDTNILLFAKAPNQGRTLCAVASKADKRGVVNMSLFARREAAECAFAGPGA